MGEEAEDVVHEYEELLEDVHGVSLSNVFHSTAQAVSLLAVAVRAASAYLHTRLSQCADAAGTLPFGWPTFRWQLSYFGHDTCSF